MNTCNKCNKQIRSSEIKSCSKCGIVYHYQCLGVPQENFAKESKAYKAAWKCSECKPVEKRSESSSTPSHSQPNKQCQSVESPAVTNNDDLKQYINNKLEESLSQLLKDIRRDFTTESTDTRNRIQELTESVNFMSINYDKLKEALDDKTKIIGDQQIEICALHAEVTNLNVRLNQIEQQSRDSNLEIQCVPEHKAENLKTVIHQLVATVGCGLPDSELLNYHRVAKINQESNRPRSIVVRLSSPLIRDKIIAAVKTFNRTHQNDKLNSSHLGIADEKKPVFVGEHLSPGNKQLHAAARKAAKEKKYQFVWVRGGRIYMRKDVNSKSIVVRDLDFINSLQ